METSLTDIKDLVEIAKPFVDPIISTLIQPKINKLAGWLKKRQLEYDIQDSFFVDKFKEYISRTYNNCQNINVLIFQNQQIKLKEIYYPLTIASEKDGKTVFLDDFKASSINEYNKILISDTAGMGKSTLSKFITLKAIENNIAIPIHIELRNLKEDHSVIDEILLQINPIDKSFDKVLIFKFLEMGQFLIVFDGFDEIQLKNQDIIIKDLRDFISKTSANQFILTSRPEGALASFGDFQAFNILSLKLKDAFEIIYKYDALCPVKVASKLIYDIKNNFKGSNELLGNPFLISLIYSSYTYNKDIATNKITFYEEIYSALFKRHDLSKDGWTRPKKSKLDILQFKIILRQLAFDTSILGTITYTQSEIIQHLSSAKTKCVGIDFNEVDYLDDLLSSVPLFQRDGNKIKWAHKSLQDYFSADFIAFSSRKDEIIRRIYDSEKESFMNILDLFFELDPKTFRNIIVLKLLEEFILYYKNTYKHFENVNTKWVDERKTISFAIDLHIIGKEPKTNDLFDYLEKNIPSYKTSTSNTTIGKHSYITVQSYSLKRYLIKMLGEKKVNFIRHKEEHRRKLVKFKNYDFEILKIDDSDLFYNSPMYFNKINSAYSFLYNIDYNMALAEVNNIEKQIRDEVLIDLFNDI